MSGHCLKSGIKKTISCILFGSIARKQERPNSDIDLLILAKNKKLIQDLIYEKQKYFTEKYATMEWVVEGSLINGHSIYEISE